MVAQTGEGKARLNSALIDGRRAHALIGQRVGQCVGLDAQLRFLRRAVLEFGGERHGILPRGVQAVDGQHVAGAVLAEGIFHAGLRAVARHAQRNARGLRRFKQHHGGKRRNAVGIDHRERILKAVETAVQLRQQLPVGLELALRHCFELIGEIGALIAHAGLHAVHGALGKIDDVLLKCGKIRAALGLRHVHRHDGGGNAERDRSAADNKYQSGGDDLQRHGGDALRQSAPLSSRFISHKHYTPCLYITVLLYKPILKGK